MRVWCAGTLPQWEGADLQEEAEEELPAFERPSSGTMRLCCFLCSSCAHMYVNVQTHKGTLHALSLSFPNILVYQIVKSSSCPLGASQLFMCSFFGMLLCLALSGVNKICHIVLLCHPLLCLALSGVNKICHIVLMSSWV